MARKLKKKNTTVKKIIKKTRENVVKSSTQVDLSASTSFSIPNVEFVEAVGRRKAATARVRLYQKPGDFVVNDKVVGEYFSDVAQAAVIYNSPFHVTETLGKYAVTVKVIGSGTKAQLEAVRHGLSRALIKLNPDLRPLLKKAGFLTRDDRTKETRKIGMGGKARRQRQSPKR